VRSYLTRFLFPAEEFREDPHIGNEESLDTIDPSENESQPAT
jgi:hypothetical protein